MTLDEYKNSNSDVWLCVLFVCSFESDWFQVDRVNIGDALLSGKYMTAPLLLKMG